MKNHRSLSPRSFAIATALVATACQGTAGAEAACGSGAEPPAICQSSGATTSTYPPGPYGISVGDRFEDFELEDCDGEPVRFSDLMADAELVMFNVGAGWCKPCIDESETLDCDIFVPFCGRGLRVVQVLFQKEDGLPATKLFCKQWRERFGLSFPVVVDPTFATAKYFQDPSSQTPLTLLVDKEGTIVFREVGEPSGDLDLRIDGLLPPL